MSAGRAGREVFLEERSGFKVFLQPGSYFQGTTAVGYQTSICDRRRGGGSKGLFLTAIQGPFQDSNSVCVSSLYTVHLGNICTGRIFRNHLGQEC